MFNHSNQLVKPIWNESVLSWVILLIKHFVILVFARKQIKQVIFLNLLLAFHAISFRFSAKLNHYLIVHQGKCVLTIFTIVRYVIVFVAARIRAGGVVGRGHPVKGGQGGRGQTKR